MPQPAPRSLIPHDHNGLGDGARVAAARQLVVDLELALALRQRFGGAAEHGAAIGALLSQLAAIIPPEKAPLAA